MTNQFGFTQSEIAAESWAHLIQEGVNVILGGLHEQRAAEIAQELSEDVEPRLDMCDSGFLGLEHHPRSHRNYSASALTSFSSSSMVRL